METLVQRARAVLKRNDCGDYTRPTLQYYHHQWAWDSGFCALGWASISLERAVRELQSLFTAQWDDGRVPAVRYNPQYIEQYFPGPDVWGSARSFAVTQPPVWAIAANRLLRLGADADSLRALVPKLERAHRFLREQRDPLGWGLVAVAHPWESGLDNSPAWDEPLQAVDESKASAFERLDTRRIKASQRPTNKDYRHYLALAAEICANDYRLGSFAVYDPMASAILIRAEESLADLASDLGLATDARQRARCMRETLVNRLWDAEASRFAYHDAIADRRLCPDVLAAYLPLMIELPETICTATRRALDERYSAPWRYPSTAPGSPAFDPQRYWRGPVWMPLNWLLCDHIGQELIESSLELMQRSGLWEYYDPLTGEGLGCQDFAWTAAIALDFVSRLESKRT